MVGRERPISLRPWEILPVKEGRRKQLIRRMDPQPSGEFAARDIVPMYPYENGVRWFEGSGLSALRACPYANPGDRLWVRHTYGADRMILEITFISAVLTGLLGGDEKAWAWVIEFRRLTCNTALHSAAGSPWS